MCHHVQRHPSLEESQVRRSSLISTSGRVNCFSAILGGMQFGLYRMRIVVVFHEAPIPFCPHFPEVTRGIEVTLCRETAVVVRHGERSCICRCPHLSSPVE